MQTTFFEKLIDILKRGRLYIKDEYKSKKVDKINENLKLEAKIFKYFYMLHLVRCHSHKREFLKM